ncbi:mannitol-1-phosphate 5-dehydrogenase [Ammoniphilus sp. 3BR4]|uniref:mannitol-1-phosphate 5-dehydrogenase n=1 Tax=Ammoniphilus sp. 3BR4 TaxID=3158265 RepID=UPI003467619E
MLAVHFGAGNIGRGFIGQLLHQAGYEVCFIDVNQELVDEINRRNEYTIVLADKEQDTISIKGVRALNGNHEEEVSKLISDADLVTTAVGPNILKFIAPAIAKGIELRLQANNKPLNVIACENMIGGSSRLKSYVYDTLNETEKEKADEMIGFPNSAVDRIVPIQSHSDKLLVSVEPFFEWVVNQTEFVGDIPQIEGLTYVDDLSPYIERKLFTVNTGHAVVAYLGYHLGFNTIDQAIGHDFIFDTAKNALRETGDLLIRKYQFDKQNHEEYIDKILRRFANPFITDEVTRVGRSPMRKLSPQDRLVAPARQAFDYHIVPNHLGLGIAAAYLFDYEGDPEAQEIQNSIKVKGLEKAIHQYSSIPYDHALFTIVLDQIDNLKKWQVVS